MAYMTILLAFLISALCGCGHTSKSKNVLAERSGYFEKHNKKLSKLKNRQFKDQKTIDIYMYPNQLTDDLYMHYGWVRMAVGPTRWQYSHNKSKDKPFVHEKLMDKKKK